MAHGVRIDGTAYSVSGGKTRVDGTFYGVSRGRTRVDGTGRDITFARTGPTTVYFYGTGESGMNPSRCYMRIGDETSPVQPRFKYDFNLTLDPGTSLRFYLQPKRGETAGVLLNGEPVAKVASLSFVLAYEHITQPGTTVVINMIGAPTAIDGVKYYIDITES